MSRRNFLRPHRLFTSRDSTLNPASEATDISGLDNITHLLKVDPTVTGELFVEFSVDDKNPTTWDTLYFGESLIINGAVETVYSTHIRNPGFKFMRLRFSNNAGLGNLNGWISGNSVGA